MTEPGAVGDGTRAVRAGAPEPAQGEPLRPGPTLAAPFRLRGDPESSPYFYGRYHNPTFTAYERALAELEGGEAVVFASGMAAVAAVLLPMLKPGDVLVAPSDGYFALRALAEVHLGERSVEVRLVPTAGDHRRALEGATLVWLETPCNPRLDTCDIRALAESAHQNGALVGVDNTLATPLGQRPLELGADFSMAADTKGLAGHSDLVMGHVAVRDPARAEALRSWRTLTGAVPGPFETWLAHRSLGTLHLRLERACATARVLAELLAARADVSAVRHPGLSDDPAHPVAARQMRRFGTVVSFELADSERAERFLDNCELVAHATSFGGLQSTAERRARWGGDEVPEGFIRFSVGCEDPEDLLGDVERSLDGS